MAPKKTPKSKKSSGKLKKPKFKKSIPISLPFIFQRQI